MEIHGEVDRNQIRRAATRAGQEGGDHFSKAFFKKFQESVDRTPLFGRGEGFTRRSRFGRAVASQFMSDFAEGILTPNRGVVVALRTGIPAVLGSPFGVAAVALAAVFVASFAAAIISSGVSALFGGLFIGLGALALRENELIRTAFRRTARQVDSAFADSAQGLVEPFVQAADDIGAGFVTRLAPRLRSIFDDLAPGVAPLVEGVLGSVERLLARVQPFVGEFTREFLVPFSAQLPRLGEAIGNFIGTIIRNGPLVAQAFEDIVDVTVFLLDVLDDAVIILTRLWNGFNRVHALFGPVTAGMMSLSKETGGASNSLGLLASFFSPVIGLMGAFNTIGGDSAKMMTNELSPAFGGLTAETDMFTTSQDLANASMGNAITQAGSLRDALDILSGGALAIRAANRQFEQGIDDLSEALEEHGLVLDRNIEAGRQVEAAIDAVATAVMDEAQAVFDATRQTEGLKSAQAAANEVLQQGRQRLIDTLQPFFDSRKAAEEYIDKILQIPEQWDTKPTFDSSAAENAVEAWVRKLFDIPDQVNVRVTTTFLNRFITETFGPNAPQVRRFGGISYARHGLLNLSGTAGVFPDGANLFGFAERGTGGEAFVARNAPRAASLGILDVAARWHRAVVVPMERAATTMAGAAGGPTMIARQLPSVIETHVHIGREVERVVRTILDEHDREQADRFANQGAV